MKLKKYSIAIALLVLVFAFSSCSQADADADNKAASESNTVAEQENSGIYAVTLTTAEGQTVNMADFKNKVIIVDFWDTWCPPCRMEIPHFVELYNEYNDKGLEIVGVAFARQGKEAVLQFAKDYNISYTNALVNQEVVNVFGGMPTSIPTTFIVDTDGNIHKKLVGYKEKSVFENEIKSLLNL